TERPIDAHALRRPVVQFDKELGRRDTAAPFPLDILIDERFHALREREDVFAPERRFVEVTEPNAAVDEGGSDGERNAELRVDDGAWRLAHFDRRAHCLVRLTVDTNPNAPDALGANPGRGAQGERRVDRRVVETAAGIRLVAQLDEFVALAQAIAQRVAIA